MRMVRDVTFIVPIYNARKFLVRCIESILAREDVKQLILIDDGSVDGSDEICALYATACHEVMVLHHQHQGVSAARNAGIEKAQGKWICFVDADDWIEQQYPQEQLSEGMEPDLIFMNYHRTDEPADWPAHAEGLMKAGELIKRSRYEDFLRYNLNRYLTSADTTLINSPWAKFYRTELIRRHGIRFCNGLPTQEDKLFNLYVMQYAQSGIYYELPFYHYRISGKSKAHRYSAGCIREMEIYLKGVREFTDRTGCRAFYPEDYRIRVIMVIMYDLFLDLCHPDNPDPYTVRRDQFMRLTEREPYCSSLKETSAAAFPPVQQVVFRLIRSGRFLLLNLLCRYYRM